MTFRRAGWAAAVAAAWGWAGLVRANEAEWSTSSYLGGDGSQVVAAAIRADGTFALAVNLGTGTVAADVSVAVGSGSATSSGAVVRLSADGRKVLSVARVGAEVFDLAGTPDGVVVAAGADGLVMLDAAATAVSWRASDGRYTRVDAAADGTVAALADTGSQGAAAQAMLYGATGAPLATFSVKRTDGDATDVALDATTQSVFVGGWKSAPAPGPTVPWLTAHGYGGALRWTSWDFAYGAVVASGDTAASSLERVSMGADGRLYVLGTVAAAHTVWGRDPHDVTKKVSLLALDRYGEAARMGAAAERAFYGRLDPATGDLVAGSLYQAVTKDPAVPLATSGRAWSAASGAIEADAMGRVYVVAATNGAVLPYTFDPLGLVATGAAGASLTVLAPDLMSRLLVTSILGPGGRSRFVAARVRGSSVSLVTGGRTAWDDKTGDPWLKAPVQAQHEGRTTGVFAVAPALSLPVDRPAPVVDGGYAPPLARDAGSVVDAAAAIDAAGGARDAAPGVVDASVVDAAAASSGDGGCGCRLGAHTRAHTRSSGSAGLPLVLLSGLAWLASRRRRGTGR